MKRTILGILIVVVFAACDRHPLVDDYLGTSSAADNNSLTPVITSISPDPIIIGSDLTINGANFGGSVGAISIGDRKITPTSWSDSQIRLVVPSFANGEIIVTNPFGTGIFRDFQIKGINRVTSMGSWVESNVRLKASQHFSITATGSGQHNVNVACSSYGASFTFNPDGNSMNVRFLPNDPDATHSNIKGQFIGTINGLIGDTSFAIGSSYSGKASDNDTLRFLVNSITLPNDVGCWEDSIDYSVEVVFAPL